MSKLIPFILVGCGGFIGSILRYLLSFAGQKFSISFPHGTLWANLLGCLLLGIITSFATEVNFISPNIKLLLATGVCGGFTSMSTFTYETVNLAQDSEYFYAAIYGISTLAGSAIMFFLGLVMVKLFIKMVM